MSDITGADLAHLDTLSTSFETAGRQINAKAGQLQTRIMNAVSTFESTLSSMRTEATTLTRSIDDEIDAVDRQSGGVQWTGNNRATFDGDLARFRSTVNTGTAQIDQDIVDIKTQVDSRFTPVLNEFGTALNESAAGFDESALEMRGAVADQRTNLDQAANVGWDSA